MYLKKITHWLLPIIIFSVITPVYAEAPKISIAPLQIEDSLNYREKKILQQAKVEQALREALIDSGSFTVTARDNKAVQALLKERALSKQSLAREPAGQDIGLDIASYILLPTLEKLNIATRYQPIELVPDYFERTDQAEFQLSIRILDAGGNIRFEQQEAFNLEWGPIETSAEEKAKHQFGHTKKIVKNIHATTRKTIDALSNRINPITVIDVQGGTIIIDRGDNNGFSKGSIFVIRSTPKTVTHPTTGKKFIISAEEIARAEVTQVYQKYSTLKPISGAVDKIQVGAHASTISETEK